MTSWASREDSCNFPWIQNGLWLLRWGSRKAIGKVDANAPKQLPIVGRWRSISILMNFLQRVNYESNKCLEAWLDKKMILVKYFTCLYKRKHPCQRYTNYSISCSTLLEYHQLLIENQKEMKIRKGAQLVQLKCGYSRNRSLPNS